MTDTDNNSDEEEPKKKKRISTQAAKSKGRNLQKWTRDIILKECPSLEEDDVKSTPMGSHGEDVQLSPAARKLVPFSIECKSYANMVLYSWMDQAVANAPKGMEPIVVAKANHRYPVVIVDASYFFKNFPNKRIRK